MSVFTRDYEMVIGGAWAESESGERFEATSPATGESLGTVPEGTREDASRAIAAANAARRDWASRSAFERAAALERVADLIEERRDDLARTLTLDQGKPLHAEAYGEVEELVVYWRMAAADATRVHGSMPPSVDAGKRILAYRVPRGVVGVITPWNWPYTMPAELIAPALAAGNAVVWTPATTTSVCSVKLAECIVDADLPAGVFSMVTGPGRVVGDEVAGSPGTHAVGFIGSVATGLHVAARAAGKATVLELGGNGPMVVLDDADLDAAAEASITASFLCAGQSCTAGELFLVHESVHDEFVDKVRAAVGRSVRLGDPLAEETTMGPLNNEQTAEKMDEHVADAVERGARVVVGGARASGFPTDLYWQATVLAEVTERDGSRARGDVRPRRPGAADLERRGGAPDRELVAVRPPHRSLDARSRPRAALRGGRRRGLGERQRVDELLGEPPAVRRPLGEELRGRAGRRVVRARRVHRAEDRRPHAVTTSAYLRAANQPPPLERYDLFSEDRVLVEALRREGGAEREQECADFGRVCGGDPLELGRLANENPPKLRRDDEVEFHPAWHALLGLGVEHGLHAYPWADPRPGAHVARAAKFILLAEAEAGVGCPLSMTYSAVPALRAEPALAEEWEPLLVAREKPGTFVGMALTERQGGSDVRANETRAEPLADGGYALNGAKWFCSAPMCDAFLVLAQAPGGLTCFLLPRVLADGERNGFRIARLKDKLGNRSNASAEIELVDAWAARLGEEGRGIATIIEMVVHTRLDCVLGSTALMRRAVAEATHHAAYRSVFGRLLADQPLHRNVLADLCLDSEAATATALRLARSVDEGDHAFRRIATAVAKYWICKSTPPLVAEALECIGGNGYVEESVLPRLHRESPLNSLWEGAGNVNALDLLRAAAREPESVEALLDEIDLAAG